jgi:hypothetical protein
MDVNVQDYAQRLAIADLIPTQATVGMQEGLPLICRTSGDLLRYRKLELRAMTNSSEKRNARC